MANNHLEVVHHNLNVLLEKKSQALPRGFNQTRFLQNCMTVLQDTRGIEKVDPKTTARTMLKGAFLGLDFFNKECYAIPYGGSLQFQTDYKGEIKLAKKYSINPIKDIYAKLVREGDSFEEAIVEGQQKINFAPIPFNNGKIIGAFAVVLFKDGSMMYDTMSVDEMEHIRKTFSKQSGGKAWTDSTGEMYKKTVLRRLCKLIELDFDSIEQKEAFEASSDFEFKDKPAIETKSPFNDDFIEGEYENITETTTEEQAATLDLEGTPFGEGDD